MKTHYLKGALFENLVILELLKQRFNNGVPQDIWFFRDSNHNEVDVVAENELLQWVEIKSVRTFSPDFINTFRFLDKNEDAGKDNKSVIYGGDDTFMHQGYKIASWRDLWKFEK